ncbi:MAG: Leucine-rich repeat (LRR) protein, partial [Oceanospirillaceae bacterium]
ESLILLHFNNNRFKDLPKEVSKLPNLESIDFSSNEIERLPAELLSFPKLKNVYMMGNEYNRKKELLDDVDRFIVDLERRNITVR